MSTTVGRPIGLLLRTLDRLIDERFDATLAGRGVSRRQWQLLNGLAGAPASTEALTATVAPFLGPGETARRHLEPLAAGGILTDDDDVWTLTDAGHALLGELRAGVRTIRDRTVHGLPTGEYERTVATLEAMIANLDRA